MKKVLALTLVIMSFTGSAFAGTALTSGAVSIAGTGIYGGSDATVAGAATSPLGKLSSGVSAIINFNTNSYAINTKHLKGSKVFGTAADSTNMYWKASPQALITTTEAASGSTNASFASGWTSM